MRPLSDFILTDNQNAKARSVSEMWKLTCERDAYRAEYARHWNSVGIPTTGTAGPPMGAADAVGGMLPLGGGGGDAAVEDMVDVVLCPVGPGCAPPLDCARYWGYTSQWNLLDYPAAVFPTGLKCGPEDLADREYVPRNEQDRYNHELCKFSSSERGGGRDFVVQVTSLTFLACADDPERYIDAPISLQLVGRRYEDEKVIEALEMIIEAAGLPFSKTGSDTVASKL
jgi:amidase